MGDEPPLLFKRTLTGLVPDNGPAREAMEAVRPGSVVRVRMVKPRSGPHHRKFWALMSAVADALGESVTAEKVAKVVKLRTGHVEVVKTAEGILEWPASIAFDRMDQGEFSRFYERALVVICNDFLPGVAPGDLRSQIEELVAA